MTESDQCQEKGFIMPIDCTSKGYFKPDSCKKPATASAGYIAGIITVTLLLMVSLFMNGLLVLKMYKLM